MATYTPQSPIAGDSRGTADDWIRWAEQQGVHRFDDVELYINTVYEFAPQVGIGAHKIICQSIHETSEAHPKTGKYIPWTSEAWTECVNPAGIGVTSDAMRTWHDFKNGRNAALAHLVRVCKYVFGPVPDILKPHEHLDPRGAVPASVYGQKKTLGSFGHSDWRNYPTWAANDDYGQKWADTLNRLEPVFAGSTPDPQPGDNGGNDMAGYKKYRFVGLDKDVWLPDDIEVIIDIVPSWRTNIRSNQKFTGQTYTTWHDTGNPNSDARGERNWLHSGAGGSAVGYNFAFDDKRIIQLTPLDEVTWAAGTPDGNRYSWHAEQCLAGNWDKTLRIGAALHGGLIAAKGWDVNKALVQHNVWYGKHCPAQIRNRGLWPTVVKMVAQAAAAARAAALGQDTGDAVDEVENGWPYPDPTPPAFWSEFQKAGTTHFDDGGTIWYKTNALYRVKTKTKRQQYAVQDERVVGPEMPEGLEFRAAAVGQSKTDNKAWVITPMLTRVRLDDLEFAENPDVSDVINALKDVLDDSAQ